MRSALLYARKAVRNMKDILQYEVSQNEKKMANISLDKTALEVLAGIVGCSLDSYSCDPFIFTHSAFGIIGLKVNDEYYKITAELEHIQRFFNEDDVAVLRFQKCQEEDIVSRMDNGILQTNPVKDIIKSIEIVNDHETVSHCNDSSDLISTKGIIFHMSSGNEIAFEVATWFSEMISIHRGYDVITQFSPSDEFFEEWEECDGYHASCSREIAIIQ